MAVASCIIDGTEEVTRTLRRDWVVDGVIQHYAFMLRRNETYISVNRPSVLSYSSDVSAFVDAHPDFYANERKDSYMRANLKVDDIRQTKVTVGEEILDIDVDVEMRAELTKSHAGVFTRHEGKNVKAGEMLMFAAWGEGVSSDEVLLEVRSHLLELSVLETCLL